MSDVKVWDLATGELLQVLSPDDEGAHRRLIECVAFSSDGKLLATCSHDRTAKLWDTATWKVRVTLQGHLDVVYGLAISPDDRTLATASWDGTVKLWSMAAGRLLATLGGHQGVVYSVAFSHDGKTLAAGSGHIAPGVASIRQLKLWHAATENEVVSESRALSRR